MSSTTQYVEMAEKDQQVFKFEEAFTFGIEERKNNPYFPYSITISLKRNPEILLELQKLKRKYKVTEKLFYGSDKDLIYLSMRNITEKQKMELLGKRCFIKARVEVKKTATKGENVYMDLRLLGVKKIKDICDPEVSDYSSDSD